jgi:magnesium chelatase family protein
VAGLVEPTKGVVSLRPFRAPHHTVSDAALVGGGENPRPGEVSLAHHGVLFLDELAEFRRSALEALRQPLEDGRVCIARARARVWFPARPLVVGAVNPCPCGYFGHPSRPCRCTRLHRRKYQSRLSGPLLDRLDVHVSVPPVDVASLVSSARAESSESVRRRVLAARERQWERCRRGETTAANNAALGARDLEKMVRLDAEGRRMLEASVRELGLSARAFTKVLRVARTIADLDQEASVRAVHVAEAIQGRLLDRELLV